MPIYRRSILLLVPALILTGCAMPWQTPQADPALANKLSKLAYPSQVPLGDDLDIVIVRDGRYIELVNRTAASVHDSELWLNQQYVSPIKDIGIGHNPRLDLVAFINLHGEPYPTGSFLQPEASYPLVLAELWVPAEGKKHRLLVRLEAEQK